MMRVNPNLTMKNINHGGEFGVTRRTRRRRKRGVVVSQIIVITTLLLDSRKIYHKKPFPFSLRVFCALLFNSVVNSSSSSLLR